MPEEGAKTRGLGRTVECRLLSHNGTGLQGRQRPLNAVNQERFQRKKQDPDSQTSFCPNVAAAQEPGLRWNLQAAAQCVLIPSPTFCPVPRSGRAAATGESLPPCGYYSNDSLGAQEAPADTVGSSVFFLPVYSGLGNSWFE